MMCLFTLISVRPVTSLLESPPTASVVVVVQVAALALYQVVPSEVSALALVEQVEPVAMQEK